MKNLIASLTSKIWIIACIVLTTMLTVSEFDNRDLKRKLTASESIVNTLSVANETNTTTINELRKELETKPAQVITITKEVEKEICNGKVKQEAINSLPSKKEVKNEKDVADIDDRLPPELIRLLQ